MSWTNLFIFILLIGVMVGGTYQEEGIELDRNFTYFENITVDEMEIENSPHISKIMNSIIQTVMTITIESLKGGMEYGYDNFQNVDVSYELIRFIVIIWVISMLAGIIFPIVPYLICLTYIIYKWIRRKYR